MIPEEDLQDMLEYYGEKESESTLEREMECLGLTLYKGKEL